MSRTRGPRLVCCLLATLALTFPGLVAALQTASPAGQGTASGAAGSGAGSAGSPDAASGSAAQAGTPALAPAAAPAGNPAAPGVGVLLIPPPPVPPPPPGAVPWIKRTTSDDPDPRRRNVAGLDDLVTVEVDRLDQALASLQGGCESLVLFLDGMPIEGSPPLSCNPDTGRLRFHLQRNDRSDLVWHTLLGEPRGFTRPIRVSVGPTSDRPWPTGVEAFELELIPELPFYLFVVILIVGLIVFVRLARSTSLLRDPHAVPGPGGVAPYSLARFQLAFWSFLVIAAYVFLWLITEELDTITPSVLALLGIGSGTALGASLIDAGKLEAAAETAGVQVPPAAAGDDVAATAVGAPAAAPAEPVPVPVAVPVSVVEVRSSRGFLDDLLKDERGVSLYRFQMFVWTIVLGIIFIASVYDKLAMPQFSPTLLGLMGISSGTFLGAKFPEQ